MPEQQALLPDTAAIRRDLEYMTARWGELDAAAVFEIRAFKEGSQPQTAKFAPDWMDDAVEWAEDMNGRGYNIYAVRNPIRHDVAGSAKDSDIIASFFLWADCDDLDSASNVKRFDGPQYSAAVVTGQTPSVRVHTYWALQEPCTDMAAWRDMQTRIASHFNSDRSVVNPSRIMRVAGTVSYPGKHKQERGYVKELSTLRTEYPEPRQPVSMAQMDRVFAASPSAPPAGFQIDTGTHDSKSSTDYADVLRRARTDGEKHTGVRDLAASLAGSGVPRAMAEAVIREACPVWDAGVEKLIDTAYSKFAPVPSASPFKIATGEPEPDGSQTGAGSEPANAAPTWPTPYTDFDEATLPRRQWVYGTSYIRKYVSVVASAGGIGKTSLAVVEGMSICTGKPLLGEAVKEKCNVWIINLEDPREEMVRRTLAAMKFHGITPEDITGKLFMDGEDDMGEFTMAAEGRDGLLQNTPLLDYMRDKIIANQIGVVIIDPFVSTHLVNENSNASIQAVVAMFRSLARQTEAAITLVHHTRKGNGEDATVDSVRGAGSLIGAARSARVVNRVTQEDAERLGVSAKEAKGIFRVDDGKANLAPPAEEAVYRRMIGVQLANEEWVGVATKFDLPDEWAGITDDVANEIFRLIDAGPKRDDDSEEYYSIRPQDKLRWVGQVILDYPFTKQEHFKTEGQAKAIIRQWQKAGAIEEIVYHSAAQRKDRKGVITTGRAGVQR